MAKNSDLLGGTPVTVPPLLGSKLSEGRQMNDESIAPNRRNVLKWGTSVAAATSIAATGIARAQAPGSGQNQWTSADERASSRSAGRPGVRDLRQGAVGYMLASEQFASSELVQIGAYASARGFHLLATSDHFQPWQANEGHASKAWVTLGVLGAHAQSWMGTTVTCPTMRYNPAIVAEAFATVSNHYPGRIFLGVGSGEALNEKAATGAWPGWQERWDRLIEAMAVIRALWSGQEVSHDGRFYKVHGRLYDPPAEPIPMLTAANGKKSMRLAGQCGDGLITDPETWQKHRQEWVEGARSAGKNPADMPVLVEQYVVVGDHQAALRPAELWRFGPKAFKTYYNVASPVRIEQLADQQIPISQVLQSWAVGADPQVHIDKLRQLFDSGVSIVNVHCAQADQRMVLDFYGREVLPHFRQAPVGTRRFSAER